MPGIYAKNLPQELVDYIKDLKGDRTWAQWLREIQTDFRKKQNRIEALESQIELALRENEALQSRIQKLQGMVNDV